MNLSPKLLTTNHSRGHPREFEQIIIAKSHNFSDRTLVFTAIEAFIHRYHQGYFTIIGAPGSGKSAIVAKYTLDNSPVLYYNVEVDGKSCADEFIRTICTQLLEMFYEPSQQNLPDNATEGSWFLSLLLQQISEQLQPSQKLIIVIDGLNFSDRNSQYQGANLFYLPRYLPDGVYFLLTRRPFLREKSGLLIESPSQTLDLANYPAENRQDIEVYIRKYLTPEQIPANMSEAEFCTRLVQEAENNFMYLSHVLPAVTDGLESYYQQHLQRMMQFEQNSEFSLAVLNILAQEPTSISVGAIASLLNTDEFEVEEVLENWLEFLQQEQRDQEIYYSFYHSHFRAWLSKQQV